jgi:hypothetical protein
MIKKENPLEKENTFLRKKQKIIIIERMKVI